MKICNAILIAILVALLSACSSSGGGDTSACCLPDGSCVEADPGTCQDNGGRFKGEGSVCSPAICDLSCASDADCDPGYYCHGSDECRAGCRVDPDDCQGSICNPDTHLCEPTEACCGPGGECTDRVQGECPFNTLGQGTSCANDTCPQLSACCLNGSCSLSTQAGCAGTFVDGVAVGCDPNPCCGSDSDCEDEEYCLAICTTGCRTGPNNCPGGLCDSTTRECAPSEACCDLDGSCTDVFLGVCEGLTGTYPLGESTVCGVDACPPLSACCQGSQCSTSSQTACVGTYLTGQTACNPNPCCDSDEQCDLGTICEQSTCVPGCRVDQDCEVGTCDPASLLCVYDTRYQFLVEGLKGLMPTFGVHGMAVAVIEGGEVTFATGLGVTEPDGTEWVRASTLFRIASLTKSQTAVALLQQVDAGNLDLDEPITTTLPGLVFDGDPGWAQSITPRHLLTHSSAMKDILQWDVPDMLHDGALNEYVYGDFTSEVHLMAPAGRMYNYSNSNYFLAGLMAETLSGEFYRDYMRDRVWQPLGMNRTFLLPEEVIADGDYMTTIWSDGSHVQPDGYDNGWGRPAGFAFSNVLDLAEFVKFLRNGNPAVLSDTLRLAMQEPQINSEQRRHLHNYGFGLYVYDGEYIGDDFYDIHFVLHPGFLGGYQAELYWVPALDFGMVTLAAGVDSNFTFQFVEALETLCVLPAPVPGPDMQVDPSRFPLFEGEYFDPYTAGQVVIGMSGESLTISVPDFETTGIEYNPILVPITPNNFWLNWMGGLSILTFLFDENGQVEYLRVREFVAERVTTREGKSLERKRTLDPEALRERLERAEPIRPFPFPRERRPER